jgi:hypothetical protein
MKMTRTHTTTRRNSLALLALGLVAGLTQTTMARNIVVPVDFQTIGEAIEAAEEHDTIFLKSGRYDETIDVTRKSLQIVGCGNSPLETMILCNDRLHTVSAWRNDHKVKFRNLTFLKDDPETDGSIRIDRTLVEFRECHFIGLGNRGGCNWGGGHYSTGAMYLNSAEVGVIDCHFLANTAEIACDGLAMASGGAIYAVHTNLRVIQSTFMGNVVRAAATGGQPVNEDDYAKGGAISTFGGSLQVKDSTFEANQALNIGRQRHFGVAHGGAICVWDSSPVLIQGTTFQGNQAEWNEPSANDSGTCSGGAIWIRANAQVLTGNTYTDNSSSQLAGAVYSNNNSVVTDSRFECNLPDHLDGWYREHDNMFLECPPPCPADLDGNGTVDFNDYMILVQNWGPAEGSPADLNDDGLVNYEDLILMLDAWGGC